jgi:RNA-directed DNA polymerase
MKFFMAKYKEISSSFAHKTFRFPVILLVDNDDGANEIFSTARTIGVKDISHSSTLPFYYIGHNLYLIKTPEGVGTKVKTCIEDLFYPDVLGTTLDGKKFDPNKRHDEPGKYGKEVFAKRVVKPNISKINFDKFDGLLDRILAVLDDYSSRATVTSST